MFDTAAKLDSFLVSSSHCAVGNQLTNAVFASECLWMLCLTLWPQKYITHTTKSQSLQHLWVFSQHCNLQLSWVQCLSFKSKWRAGFDALIQKLTVVLHVHQKPVTSVKTMEFHMSFDGLCLVLCPILVRKSKERLSAAVPDYPNDVLLQLSLDFHLSLSPSLPFFSFSVNDSE